MGDDVSDDIEPIEIIPEEEPTSAKAGNLYNSVISAIFFKHFDPSNPSLPIPFNRRELKATAIALGMDEAGNDGDILYSFRFRKPFPKEILDTQPEGFEWRLDLNGRSKYLFKLAKPSKIIPDVTLEAINIPDATPEIIKQYSLSDEQAALAIIRYNRLLDVFLALTTSSLQNHLRTTAKGFGQVEIDEVYIAVDSDGLRYVIPVQAKGGSDKISVVQTMQDLAVCQQKFPGTIARPVSVQIMPDGKLCMFELKVEDDETLSVVRERHYVLSAAPTNAKLGARMRKALGDRLPNPDEMVIDPMMGSGRKDLSVTLNSIINSGVVGANPPFTKPKRKRRTTAK
ncbi:hypothetical protein KTR66_20925 [Roseococcus sp. SDR]|uniref:hypothetical protein n=1 Tax=Roseococcus sp. SDR TaxID=2835532 RepID=UPI001BCD88D7|nr:hypothetical protein [Roseococcus sp. SDR]MBS7792469.1 hypothetical protein [Roseococcus sp. SDR]MBV1847783.1 hypothetical protein [Roseococcus sp. SDR]